MGQAASTTSASQALYASAKTGCAADVQRLAATGAGLEWRDQKGRTPLMVVRGSDAPLSRSPPALVAPDALPRL